MSVCFKFYINKKKLYLISLYRHVERRENKNVRENEKMDNKIKCSAETIAGIQTNLPNTLGA